MSESEVTPEAAPDFASAEPLPGLEHLGRAIVDEAGVPSGSPANYENLRGKGAYSISNEARDKILADLAAEFPTADDMPANG